MLVHGGGGRQRAGGMAAARGRGGGRRRWRRQIPNGTYPRGLVCARLIDAALRRRASECGLVRPSAAEECAQARLGLRGV